VLKVCKFQFPPIHPPLGDFQELCLLVAPYSPVLHRTCTVHCPVRLWPLLWLLRELSAHYSVAGVRCRRPLRWLAVAPLVHRTVGWIIAERDHRNPKVASLELYGPGAPDSPVRQTRASFGSFAPFFWTLNLIFYWFVLNFYAPVEYII
jgi:hypothetical protein